MKKIIVGVMWPGVAASKSDLENAYEIWKFCAEKNRVTLTGWRNEWVMEEALRGAKEWDWLTIGVLPSDDRTTFSKYIDIPICTNMRSWRNYINVLSSDIIVACGIDHGTSSEISLAIKPWKKIILVWLYEEANNFFKKLAPTQVCIVTDYVQAIKILEQEINTIQTSSLPTIH